MYSNITHKYRRNNIWVRERTKVIDLVHCEKNEMVLGRAGHIDSRLKDNRWTSRATTWRPYDKKRRQGRPAKRWRDDLDKYWSYTIWQAAEDSTRQGNLETACWSLRPTMRHNGCLMMMMCVQLFAAIEVAVMYLKVVSALKSNMAAISVETNHRRKNYFDFFSILFHIDHNK